MSLSDEFKAARRVSQALIAVTTPDPEATIGHLAELLPEAPVIEWNISTGPRGRNKAGEQALKNAFGDMDLTQLISLPEFLYRAQALPGGANAQSGTLLFIHNAHRFLAAAPHGPGGNEGIAIMQAVWNLRDIYKQDWRTMVLLGPHFTLPPELAQDVLLMEEPYPKDAQLSAIACRMFESAKLPKPPREVQQKIVAATRGLAAYPAETAIVMSLKKSAPDNIDLPGVWSRKERIISATKGLSVAKGNLTFKDVGGVEEAKKFFLELGHGRDAFELILWLDEMEKMLAGGLSGKSGDSGVSQDQMATLLTEMEEQEMDGALLFGLPGCTKSMLAKALAGELGIPCVRVDTGGMKGEYVGQSEQAIRHVMRLAEAMSGGHVLVIGTVNQTVTVTPEMKRRFPIQVFFDLLSKAERGVVWPIYKAKYELPDEWFDADGFPKGVNDDQWTGAEIRNCSRFAYRMRKPLTEVQRYIVPTYKAVPSTVRDLRAQAHGVYLSASYPGTYQDPARGAPPPAPAGRGAEIE